MQHRLLFLTFHMKEYDGNYSDGTYQDVEVGHPQILMRDKIKLQWRNKQNM